VLTDEEKLKKMKYFQKSMNLFLETQERFQQQRLAMMEKMWAINQQMMQGLLGAAPPPAIPARVESAPAQAPERPAVEAVQPPQPAEQTPTTDAVDFRTLLFEIVSERTQYPVEMLAPEQLIEADLGIDSIKRVEIISMLQTTHPSLADIGNEKYFEEMAQLKSLGDVVAWIQAHFGATGSGPRSQPDRAQPLLAAALPGDPPDYRTLLFEIVSERTQYPVEMLAPEQLIEADLGIDSIKRVEIISMLQTTHPSLADIGNEKYFEEMAQLKSLGDIVDWIQAHFGATGSGPPSQPDQGQPSPAAALPDDRPDYQAILFAVISERTQYPVEMLAPEQQIEADLGIDSIKRVEIISMLQTTHPSLADIGNEKYFEEMAQLKSLGDIVDWISRHFDQAPAPALPSSDLAQGEASQEPGTVPPGDTQADDRAGDAGRVSADAKPAPTDSPLFRRYVLSLVERPLTLARPRASHGVLLILDGAHPLGLHLQKEAARRGLPCVRVLDDGHPAPEDANCFRMNFSDEGDYPKCYQRIKKSHGLPAGILNLLALGRNSHESAYESVLRTFLWAKTIGADADLLPLKGREFSWTSVSGMGGDFGLDQGMNFEACQNGPHGIAKSLFHEWPGLQTKTIDIDPGGDPEQLSRWVLDECREVLSTIKEVGLGEHGRRELVLVDRPLEIGEDRARFNRDSVFLITGGAKGITAEVAALLAERYAPTLILAGRTPLPERSREDLQAFLNRAALGARDPKRLKSDIIDTLESTGQRVSPALVNEHFNAIVQEYKARQNIARMAQLGATVRYHACDCTDDNAFSRLIRQVYREHRKIDGVIHAAGYLKDGLITHKSLDLFKRVLDTKVQGARVLIREIDFQKLDFIAFFSSVSGRFGNQGQADYAAANEILNKMAANLDRRWPGKATAINWGPWEGEGMVSSQVKKQFDEAGVYLLPRDAGARMFHREIVQPRQSPEVIIFGAEGIEQRLPIVHPRQEAARLPFAELFEPFGPRDAPDISWQLTLDRKAPYLNDHRIGGVPVLPAAVAMEIMAQAGMAANRVHPGMAIFADFGVGRKF
jgi:NAD(P)-dependent dehydrogenase (short-subunit alcohol dehydrogenase family)/acyl carrier protein